MIRRRSSQQKGKDSSARRRRSGPVLQLHGRHTAAEEGPLFNLEELHEKRILSWSPEPEEFFEDEPQRPEEPEPTRQEREELARRRVRAAPVVVERPQVLGRRSDRPHAAGDRRSPRRRPSVSITPPAAARRDAAAGARGSGRAAARGGASRAADACAAAGRGRVEAEEETAHVRREQRAVEDAPGERAPKRRGRPRGRPRRQVHFHVDPDEERLLMLAVERYGSQQKGLIAALESLQEADLLRDEIERLRAETARHRRLLDEAESLFNR